MTQLNPSTEYESKAVALLIEMRNLLVDSQKNLTTEEINARFRDVQTRFSQIIGKPITQFELYEKGEPARSDKVNRFLNSLQKDINILEEQIELLRANAIYIHNNMNNQIQQAKNENASVMNRLKNLQLYTSSQNNEVTIFGDYLLNDNLFDLDSVQPDRRVLLESPGRITLAKQNVASENVMLDSRIKILPSSNGFPGRLVEVEEITNSTPKNPVSQNPIFRFSSQVDKRSNILNIKDNSPATWFEYENNLVVEDDRNLAENLNFSYKITKPPYARVIDEVEYPLPEGTLIDWANGPTGNSLNLDLEIDLGSLKSINELSYIPFGLENEKNNPVIVNYVEVSADQTEWEKLSPTNVIVGTRPNLQTARAAENIVIGSAVWSMTSKNIRYVRFHFEQKNPIDSKIGHVYYKTPVTTRRSIDTTVSPPQVVEEVIGGERAQGPVPTTINPTKYYDPSFSVVDVNEASGFGRLVKNTEVFNGKRWVIGIRDISLRNVEYVEASTFISQPYKINGVVDRVSIEASSYIPESFSPEGSWIRYYISPNDGLNWYQISRIQDDYIGIPELLAFNDPIPVEFREKNVGYHTVPNTVNSVRLRVDLLRPSDQKGLTPALYWYKIKVKRR